MPEDPKNPERTKRYNPDEHDGRIMGGFNIESKLYSQVRDIMAGYNYGEGKLKAALRLGHDIDIDSMPPNGNNPRLFFTVSAEQKQALRDNKITDPTWMQILGTSEVIALSAEEAERRYREMKE